MLYAFGASSGSPTPPFFITLLGHAPLGYKHLKAESGRGAWAVPDERSIPVLLALLRSYASGGHSFKSAAHSLNALGYRTTHGNPFTEGSVAQVLTNPFYRGQFYNHKGDPDEEFRDGVHQVPDEVRMLWLRCQEVKGEKARVGHPSPPARRHRICPLTGVLICDGCGQPFHGVPTVSKPRSYPRMFHSVRRCDLRPLSVAAPVVQEEFAKRALGAITLDAAWRDAILRSMTGAGPMPDREVERRRISMAMTDLKKQHLWGAITDEDFKTDFRLLDRQRQALEPNSAPAQLPNLERAAQLLQTCLPSGDIRESRMRSVEPSSNECSTRYASGMGTW
jgi:ribosomal protein L34E